MRSGTSVSTDGVRCTHGVGQCFPPGRHCTPSSATLRTAGVFFLQHTFSRSTLITPAIGADNSERCAAGRPFLTSGGSLFLRTALLPSSRLQVALDRHHGVATACEWCKLSCERTVRCRQYPHGRESTTRTIAILASVPLLLVIGIAWGIAADVQRHRARSLLSSTVRPDDFRGYGDWTSLWPALTQHIIDPANFARDPNAAQFCITVVNTHLKSSRSRSPDLGGLKAISPARYHLSIFLRNIPPLSPMSMPASKLSSGVTGKTSGRVVRVGSKSNINVPSPSVRSHFAAHGIDNVLAGEEELVFGRLRPIDTIAQSTIANQHRGGSGFVFVEITVRRCHVLDGRLANFTSARSQPLPNTSASLSTRKDGCTATLTGWYILPPNSHSRSSRESCLSNLATCAHVRTHRGEIKTPEPLLRDLSRPIRTWSEPTQRNCGSCAAWHTRSRPDRAVSIPRMHQTPKD